MCAGDRCVCVFSMGHTAGDDGQEQLKELSKQMNTRKADFRELEETLPHENGSVEIPHSHIVTWLYTFRSLA